MWYVSKRTAVLIAILAFSSTTAQAVPPDACAGIEVNDFRSTDGDDFFVGSDERDVAALGDGDDQMFSGPGNDVLCGNIGADVLGGEGGADFLLGGNGDDILAGLAGPDTLNGGYGSDIIRGHGGDDTLNAGTFDDTRDFLYDGPGIDEIIGRDDDVWFRCSDGNFDPHSEFFGLILPDPNCEV